MKIERTKTGGRLKGTPNKLTKQSRELLAEIVNNEIDNLPALLDLLEPRERAFIVTKLIPYVFPKATGDQTTTTDQVIIYAPDCI